MSRVAKFASTLNRSTHASTLSHWLDASVHACLPGGPRQSNYILWLHGLRPSALCSRARRLKPATLLGCCLQNGSPLGSPFMQLVALTHDSSLDARLQAGWPASPARGLRPRQINRARGRTHHLGVVLFGGSPFCQPSAAGAAEMSGAAAERLAPLHLAAQRLPKSKCSSWWRFTKFECEYNGC